MPHEFLSEAGKQDSDCPSILKSEYHQIKICEEPQPATPLKAGGYSIDEPRTRRALTKAIDVHFAQPGPLYEVVSESESTYKVDVDEKTCTCLISNSASQTAAASICAVSTSRFGRGLSRLQMEPSFGNRHPRTVSRVG